MEVGGASGSILIRDFESKFDPVCAGRAFWDRWEERPGWRAKQRMATANPAERGPTQGAIHKPQPVDLSAVIASLQIVVDADRPGAQVKVLLHMYGDVAEQLVHLKQRPNMHVNMLQKYRQRGMDALMRAEQLKGLLDKGIELLPDPAASAATAGGESKAAGTDGASMKDKKESDALFAQISGAIVTSNPCVQWEDVAGLEDAKRTLKQSTEMPQLFPHLFADNPMFQPWNGILLYGPPGTGKTHLAKAVATNAHKVRAKAIGVEGGVESHTMSTTFLSLSAADLVSKWVGESPKLVRTLFTVAREKAPSVVFVDEIDSLCRSRGSGDRQSESTQQILTEFLIQMQGCGSSSEGVLVIGATNLPWDLDAAILSRFQKKIYIPLPDECTRREILELQLGKTRHDLQPEHIEYLARQMNLFSARDLEGVVKQGMQECAQEFSDATSWRKVTPHPKKTSQLEYALEPVVDDGGPAGAGTLWPQGQQMGPHAKDGVIYNLSAEDMLHTRPDLLKHTILPQLSVRHLRRARESVRVTITQSDQCLK